MLPIWLAVDLSSKGLLMVCWADRMQMTVMRAVGSHLSEPRKEESRAALPAIEK